MICREAEKKGINVNPYTRHIESFTQKIKDRVLQIYSYSVYNYHLQPHPQNNLSPERFNVIFTITTDFSYS